MTQAPLRVEGLTKQFGVGLFARYIRKQSPFTAVNNISFSLKEGEILGFLGPNGAGKTTTIQMLLDVLTPTSGSVYYLGKKLTKNRSVLQNVSFASGYSRLPSSLTVRQCLTVYGLLYDLPLKTIKPRIEHVLREFDIMHLAERNASTLSAGQTTCVLLARAFLVNPSVVLMDEPTAALDPENAHRVRAFIKKQNKLSAVSILFTSHNMIEVAELCDRILILKQGAIIADNTPEFLAASVSRAHVQLVAVDSLPGLESYAKAQGLEYHTEEKHITIVVEEHAIAKLLAGIAQQGLAYDQISIEKPSLEDYFLSIARKG